eukprot:7314128-Prymnesium_polylepis.2
MWGLTDAWEGTVRVCRHRVCRGTCEAAGDATAKVANGGGMQTDAWVCEGGGMQTDAWVCEGGDMRKDLQRM